MADIDRRRYNQCAAGLQSPALVQTCCLQGVDVPRRHDYDIYQRVRTSCAFPRSGASIGLEFRACLVARTGVRAARTDLDIPERPAKPLRRYLRCATGTAQRHNGD